MSQFTLVSSFIYFVTLLAIYFQYWFGSACSGTHNEALQEFGFPGVIFVIASTFSYLIGFVVQG